MNVVLASVMSGAAVWLLLPVGRPTWRGGGGVVRASRWAGQRSVVPVAIAAALVGALAVVVEGTTLALGSIVVCSLVGVDRMARRARERRAAQQRAESVLQVCEALAGELRAGRPPLRALREGVAVWPAFDPVAAAGDLDGDVPRALRQLARLPGASGLAEVASAWQVSERSGGTLAAALSRVADSVRSRRATQQLVMSELASAQATARLVAVLPVAVLVMGAGLGSDPWRFLLTTAFGLGCLSGGLVLTYVGLAWIDRIAAAAVDA